MRPHKISYLSKTNKISGMKITVNVVWNTPTITISCREIFLGYGNAVCSAFHYHSWNLVFAVLLKLEETKDKSLEKNYPHPLDQPRSKSHAQLEQSLSWSFHFVDDQTSKSGLAFRNGRETQIRIHCCLCSRDGTLCARCDLARRRFSRLTPSTWTCWQQKKKDNQYAIHGDTSTWYYMTIQISLSSTRSFWILHHDRHE